MKLIRSLLFVSLLYVISVFLVKGVIRDFSLLSLWKHVSTTDNKNNINNKKRVVAAFYLTITCISEKKSLYVRYKKDKNR